MTVLKSMHDVFAPRLDEASLQQYTEPLVHSLAGSLSIDLDDPHIAGTPQRMAQMYSQILSPEPFTFTTFPNTEGYDEIVLEHPIRFYSLCSHHFLPFFGVAAVAYLPQKRYAGLSKLARIVEHFARRPQVQERMTQQIGSYVQEKLEPLGVAVILRGRHLCMEMRGVESPGTVTTTSFMRGAFRDNPVARNELMQLIGEAPPL